MTDQIILGCVISLVIIVTGTTIWLARFADRVCSDIDKVKRNTEIQVNRNVPVIEYRESNIKDLVTTKTIPWDIYKEAPKEELEEQIKRILTGDLAESIIPFIDIRSENDYVRNEVAYHARIRVIGR